MAKKDTEALRIVYPQITAIIEMLGRLSDMDPTPENAVAMASMIRSIRARLDNFAPVKK